MNIFSKSLTRSKNAFFRNFSDRPTEVNVELFDTYIGSNGCRLDKAWFALRAYLGDNDAYDFIRILSLESDRATYGHSDISDFLYRRALTAVMVAEECYGTPEIASLGRMKSYDLRSIYNQIKVISDARTKKTEALVRDLDRPFGACQRV